MSNNLLEWITKPEQRLKPTDLPFLDKQMTSLMESSEEIEKLVFKHPLSVILLKFADFKMEFVMVSTEESDALVSIASRADDWYTAYGVRAYSLKQTYDKLSFFATPLDSGSYSPTDKPLPDFNEAWSWEVPLSLTQLGVEKKTIVS